jgi:hypothetical protein
VKSIVTSLVVNSVHNACIEGCERPTATPTSRVSCNSVSDNFIFQLQFHIEYIS